MDAKTVTETITSGTIFWPLFPFDVVKSELGHQHRSWNMGEEIVCPNKSNKQLCEILGKKCFYEHLKGGALTCPYKNYHSYFLLEWQARIKNTIPIQNDHSLKHIEKINDSLVLRDTVGRSRTAVSVAMNHFPQYKECGDKLLAGNLCGKWPSDGDKEDDGKLDALEFWKYVEIKKPVFPLEKLSIREKFYVGCEFLGGRERDGMPAEIAFHYLIDITRIKSYLPTDKTNTGEIFIIPVLLSFFGDGKLDALLSLQYWCGDEDKKPAVQNFIAQALGSVAGIVRRQREEFLHQWCRDLRSKVGEIFDDGISNDLAADDQTAKEAAIHEGVKAIRSMALVLWADKKIKLEAMLDDKSILKTANFRFGYNCKVEFDPCHIQNCWEDNYNDKNKDRCEFICDFCKQAKISIEEGFSTGKLKGALSRNTSEELMQIAKDDPIRARVLLQGGAGGGKGVAANDFHAHCMNRIAKTLSTIEIGKDKQRLAEINFVGDITYKTQSLSFLKDWWEAVKKANIKYLVQIENVLMMLRYLPSYLELRKNDENVVYKHFRAQINGTGWWTWGGMDDSEEHYGNLKTLIERFKEQSAYPTSTKATENEKWNWCIQSFLLLLGIKLVVELQRGDNADWSFNLFQVNCGIMGGENSELAESIQRLFGRSDKGRETPGLFQTCSDVGGTRFLDEIADAPVRIQDNLLRPLEEGKVSRPGWETIDEEVKNIRIVGATFKDMFKLSAQYQETLPSGKPKGFRPDLLTRLTRNPPVTVVPIWHHFVPDGRYNEKALRNQFCYVMAEAATKEKLLPSFWDDVYQLVTDKINDHCRIAAKHLPDELDRRRHFASKITMRLFMALKERNVENKVNLHKNDEIYLDRMLDYLLCDS